MACKGGMWALMAAAAAGDGGAALAAALEEQERLCGVGPGGVRSSHLEIILDPRVLSSQCRGAVLVGDGSPARYACHVMHLTLDPTLWVLSYVLTCDAASIL